MHSIIVVMSTRIIKHSDNEKGGEFYIENDQGDRLATMHYVHTGATMIIIDHTEVDDSLQGKGVGKKLLNAIVDYARSNTYKVLATCPYARAQFEKNPEQYSDVVR